MATIPDLKKHCVDALKRKLPSITCVIRTRNSLRSAYVRDFQLLSQPHTVNIQCDVYKHLDLVTAFHGLTIVTFTDKNSKPQPSTSKQEDQRPFLLCISNTLDYYNKRGSQDSRVGGHTNTRGGRTR